MGQARDRKESQDFHLPISLSSNNASSEDDGDKEEAFKQYLPTAVRHLLDNLTLHFRQYGKKSLVPKTLTISPN